MKKIRKGTFETNSSSMHSLVVEGGITGEKKEAKLPLYPDGTLEIETGEYGWGYELLKTPVSKLEYLITLLCYTNGIETMEELEEKAPEINTGYVIPFQFGGFGNPKVDFFVIEDFSYQELLVLNAQQQGHEVYVWTINSEDVIQKYLNSPVNGIITDEVQIVKDFKDDFKKNNTLMDQFLRALGITLVFSK